MSDKVTEGVLDFEDVFISEAECVQLSDPVDDRVKVASDDGEKKVKEWNCESDLDIVVLIDTVLEYDSVDVEVTSCESVMEGLSVGVSDFVMDVVGWIEDVCDIVTDARVFVILGVVLLWEALPSSVKVSLPEVERVEV